MPPQAIEGAFHVRQWVRLGSTGVRLGFDSGWSRGPAAWRASADLLHRSGSSWSMRPPKHSRIPIGAIHSTSGGPSWAPDAGPLASQLTALRAEHADVFPGEAAEGGRDDGDRRT